MDDMWSNFHLLFAISLFVHILCFDMIMISDDPL